MTGDDTLILAAQFWIAAGLGYLTAGLFWAAAVLALRALRILSGSALFLRALDLAYQSGLRDRRPTPEGEDSE